MLILQLAVVVLWVAKTVAKYQFVITQVFWVIFSENEVVFIYPFQKFVLEGLKAITMIQFKVWISLYIFASANFDHLSFRWGPNGVTMYKDNMVKLMKLFKNSLPPETLVIWTTAPPVSMSCSGALLIKQVSNMYLCMDWFLEKVQKLWKTLILWLYWISTVTVLLCDGWWHPHLYGDTI